LLSDLFMAIGHLLLISPWFKSSAGLLRNTR
jgi:hypothetical protein